MLYARNSTPSAPVMKIGPSAPSSRKMVRSSLMGGADHVTLTGVKVHIWQRDERFIARGYFQGKAFGETLGSDLAAANAALRAAMVEIDNGTFVRSSERSRRVLKHGPPTRLTLRQLFDRFLQEKRRTRGRKTFRDYQARLMPVLEFIETPKHQKRWQWVEQIDDAFALALQSSLATRQVSRNGHPTAAQRRISSRQVFNILSLLATVFNWAKHPKANLLPSFFVNPFTPDLIGIRPQKDPLAPPSVPLTMRIEMVKRMDAWQLCALALPFILPHRPEDFMGLLISEVDFAPNELRFGTRMGGDDFNKGGLSFRSVWPVELERIIRRLINGRTDGPLILRRTVVEGCRMPKRTAQTLPEIREEYERKLTAAPVQRVQAPHDHKDLFRGLLSNMGGVSRNNLRDEFKQLAEMLHPGKSPRLYDLRGSVTTDLKNAGVDTVLRRYVTGHSLKGEILADYESQDLHRHMPKYFEFIKPLLTAIATRAEELKI